MRSSSKVNSAYLPPYCSYRLSGLSRPDNEFASAVSSRLSVDTSDDQHVHVVAGSEGRRCGCRMLVIRSEE